MNPTAAGEDPVDRPVRPSAEALTVARILEIRDALLPSQGEPFDCVAFAVEIVKAERRARKAEAALAAKNDDQAWDRNAERITREALGDDVTRPINPNATSIDDL